MKNKFNRLIYKEEYVKINGIDQYLFHSGISYDNSVMLFLHGGPGQPEDLIAGVFQNKWEEIFTVVHWDQRGAGKTLIKNPDKYPTIDLMLKDLYEIIKYLKKVYNKQKIIILGHSWGSALGSTFIRKYPEDVACYIGTGQMINMVEGEQVIYKKIKEIVFQNNDKKSIKKLEALGDYPGDKFKGDCFKKIMRMRMIMNKYNLGVKIAPSTVMAVFKSPIFKLSDISALIKSNRANKGLQEFLFGFNLKSEQPEYKVPVYYILGEDDWQTPCDVAKEYFNTIKAPHKDLYIIPNAGHMTMLDQPEAFFNALEKVKLRVEN